MVDTSDPPSDERKRTEFWRWVRGKFRKLVNRQTLITALRVIELIVRLAEVVSRMFGGF